MTKQRKHDESMRYFTWGYNEEKIRTRLGYNAYHMRHWLILLRRSWSLSSYSLPMSMLTPGGINHDKLFLLILFIICQSLYSYTEPLKHYSAPVSQPVSILFVIVWKMVKLLVISKNITRSLKDYSLYGRLLLTYCWTWCKHC